MMARPDEFDLAAEETPMTDDEIIEAIQQLFADDERVDDTYIDIAVEKGIVRLEGAVGSQEEKEMAESLLDNIEAIEQVINELQVVESGYTEEERREEQYGEEEFEGVEVLPADETLVTEDVIEAVEEGKSYVPPTEPHFPTERGDAAERLRQRRAEEEATGKTKDML